MKVVPKDWCLGVSPGRCLHNTVLLDAKGDVPCAPGRLVVVMVVVVVVQGWYREHLVGRRRHTVGRARGVRGSRARERKGNGGGCNMTLLIAPQCHRRASTRGEHEEPGAFLWSRPIARPPYGGNFIKWILIDAVLRLTI